MLQWLKKRKKIVEQIGIVFLFAVLIPMSVSGFIINNINQQSMRYQLRESAVLIANMVSDEVEFFIKTAGQDLEELPKDELFRSLKDEKRQIYILSGNGKLLAAHNYKEQDFQKTISYLPKKLKKNTPVIFGRVKNQPLVYVNKDKPDITIIVNTTAPVSRRAIDHNSFKIILSVLAATFTIIFIVALYIYYLYINIRQLFKGIIAISKGNYSRQIRLLITAFTPHEIVFLAMEFNRMASEIQKADRKLKENNDELKRLDEFRSNLIDTVSHELRTPLTSIQGYASRLMRQDIQIDDETRLKSLRIIKEQSEILKHLIDDLLTIPDIEGMRLRTVIEPVWLPQALEESVLLVKNKENKEIIFNISKDFPQISADKGRLVQVLVNLLENAVKYANSGSKITVDAAVQKKFAKIFIKNECEVIPPKTLKKLFDKFIRLDNNTTRTTRGTGLGLFIVKGLIEAMNGKISLSSGKNCGFCVEIKLPPAKVKV
ncbi:MAG: HAMP domain-containing histidine kinase [Heliobacteriaceae bacterium]|jgi:signal transduction histidine kinase|nr:HAMP domain-containing histidine kinase [Heliobacteriaceae bacterium]